jgi:mercuric ion transport protein
MAGAKLFVVGAGSLLLAGICCAAPSLVIAIGSLGLSALAVQAGYVLIPILLAAIGVVGFGLYRRNRSASSAHADCRKVDANTRKLKP